MKKYLCALSALVIVGFGCSPSKDAAKTITKESLETNDQKAFYAIGLNIAESFKSQGIDADLDILLQGLKDGTAEDSEPLIAQSELQTIMTEFQQNIQKRQQEKRDAESVTNIEEGKKFLDENSKKEGVITLPSGLQYKIIKEGNGPIPTSDQTVECHYEGSLISGKVFDSSIKRGEPAKFPVTGVIPGWVEALQIMPVGSKWKLFIPSDLAYGERGAGADISPNATLIFDLELIKIAE